MPGFLLKRGNFNVMDLLLPGIKIQGAVGTVYWSLSGKGKTFSPRPLGSFICIPDPLLLLRLSTCLPHVKGGMWPRFSPRTHFRCRDPKAPVLRGVLPQKRGSKRCKCCNRESVCGKEAQVPHCKAPGCHVAGGVRGTPSFLLLHELISEDQF